MTTNEYAEVFKEETYEILEELETALLELESAPNDPDLVAKIFRAIHTIKGSGAMFGFDIISAFSHEVENVYDRVREGELATDKKLIDLTLMSRDFIKQTLEMEGDSLDDDAKALRQTIFDGLKEVVKEGKRPPDTTDTEEEPPVLTDSEPVKEIEVDIEAIERELAEHRAEQERKLNRSEQVMTTYRIRFAPSRTIQERGTDLVALLKEVHVMGECHSTAHLKDIPNLEEITPTQCYVTWDIVLSTDQPLNAIRDVFIFVEDESTISIDVIDRMDDALGSPDYKKVGNIMIEKGDLSKAMVDEVAGHRKKLGEMLVEEGIVEPDDVTSALVEQQHVREVRKKRQETEVASSLRVSSEKVDQLVNMVGELVTLQARLSQLSQDRNDSELISLAEEVERITWELRDNSMEMRMLSIGSTFSRFKRLVRDLSNSLGKKLELTTEGGDTELDKTVIEKLNDPLVHIIRNSIDHGIEAPAAREAAGKPVGGYVHLNAFHSGSNVVIQVSDDGAGLDTEKIRKKAIERNVIQPNQDLTDNEIFNLIFEPGFSTAEKVSDVSGRGVGMDVVKRNIQALRGSIEIDSVPGSGTTFTLNIPLTLAIIDGLLVKIGDESFVFPLGMVESCIEIPHQVIAEANGQQYVNVRDEIVPYIYLREQFEITRSVPEIEQIVITDIEKRRIGFVVDHVIGGHQTVIKSLGKVYQNVDGISGATILGDGTIALILDVPKLLMITGLSKKRLHSRIRESS